MIRRARSPGDMASRYTITRAAMRRLVGVDRRRGAPIGVHGSTGAPSTEDGPLCARGRRRTRALNPSAPRWSPAARRGVPYTRKPTGARSSRRAGSIRCQAAVKLYRSAAWQRLRAVILAEHPPCTVPDCGQPATEVDHVVALRHGGAALDPLNLRPYCRRHHSAKSTRTGSSGSPGTIRQLRARV